MIRLPKLGEVLLGVGVLLVLGTLGVSVRAFQEAPFPHEAHQGLFPLCTGCHEGVPTGDESDFYPDPASCDGCHDGVREVTVTWNGPTERVDNVTFSHSEHAEELAEAGDPEQQCASCHIQQGGERMAVSDDIQLDTCWGCHAHEATDHQVDASCESCHIPLARTAFDLTRIESLPVPEDHDSGAFLASEHGRLVQEDATRCATCHTQQRCVSCHVDTEPDVIAQFPAAPPDMELPPPVAHYNEPATHLEQKWMTLHGVDASRQECATCHTSNDCTVCHVRPLPDAILAMPGREQVTAPGVGLEAHAPDSHESVFFLDAHSGLAAANESNCSTCHEEQFCVSCHDGPVGGGYHESNFVARHQAEAFGRDTECANCHNTAVFCRECHVQVGLASSGRLGSGYHNDGPVWLIRHGQAARQNLESCASCHQQIDCTQCHGVLGAFKVSPHGVSFDAERAWARSPRTCLACHVGNPLNGR
ncbi:MAG: cytochrome c3 family protein [Gemmatimonadota bacterium]|jgi:hypothetical protein